MINRSQDFVRQMPDSAHHFGRPTGVWRALHIDPILLVLLVCITVVGVLILYSGSGQSVSTIKRQLFFFGVGYIAMVIVAQVPTQFLRHYAFWFYLFGVVVLLLVPFIGVGAKGAQRWISLGFIRFQPSEILKLALPIAISSYFATRVLPPKLKHIFAGLIVVFIPTLLILKQPDLGTAILIFVSGIIVLFLAGLPWRFIIACVLLLIASGWPMWNFVMEDYQKQRVLTLLDPEADKLGAGWNIIQSKTAIGSGGMYGNGWLQGSQSQLDFLPESHTDFIIAVLAEGFGFVGVVILLALYTLVIGRGLYVSVTANTTFDRLLGGSITLTFFCYVFVNIGMVTGLLPVVGVPLPLVSLGGTSIVTLMTSFGLLMAIATQKDINRP